MILEGIGEAKSLSKPMGYLLSDQILSYCGDDFLHRATPVFEPKSRNYRRKKSCQS